MSQVADLLEQVASGKLTTAQAAHRLRALKPAQRQPDAQGLAVLGQDDPSGYPVSGDGHELAEAYHQGKISNEQYSVLAHAFADRR